MDIYEDDGSAGIIDIRKARRELAASGSINIAETRKANVAEITAGALLDIARSLRLLGDEAADAMRERYPLELSDEPERDDHEIVWRELLVVGDLVVVRDSDEPGEILAFGYDQDTLYALVKFGESGDERRVWAHLLERVFDEDEPDDAPAEDEPDEAPAAGAEMLRPDAAIVKLPDGSAPPVEDGLHVLRELNAEADDEPDFDERDFDTDTGDGIVRPLKPTAPPVSSPLDALAEKAPAKKKGKK